jgi:hypothetical protein
MIMKSTDKLLLEENEFLKDLLTSLKDIKAGRIKDFK